jgi:spore maturation protein CgeB
MTLFETTGIGTFLLTDQKSNLSQFFELDREIVAYTDAQDCIAKALYYLDHEQQREAIAQAGQRRTLGEHTYHKRMVELVDVLKGYL